MKRPFFVIGFLYLMILMVASFFPLNLDLALLLLSIITLIVFISIKRLRKLINVVLAFTVILSLGSSTFCQHFYNKNIEKNNKQKVDFSGEIVDDYDTANGNFIYTVKVNTFAGKNANFKVRMFLDDKIDVDYYDVVTGSGIVNYSSEEKTHNYWKSKGIFANIICSDYPETVKASGHAPGLFLVKVRRKISLCIDELFKNNASVIKAMTLGDKSNISKDVSESFRKSGISHLLVVSGTHVAAIITLILFLLVRLKIHKKLKYIICVIFIGFYIILIGMSPSVTRAGLMAIITLIACIINREADPINSLGFALFLILVFNPFGAFDVGLLLSFFSTLGVLIAAPLIYGFLKCRFELLNFISKALSVTLGATVFILPIIVVTYKEISVVCPLTNLLAVYPAAIMLMISVIAIAFGMIPIIGKFIAFPFAFISSLICRYICYIAKLFSDFKYSVIKADYYFVYVWVIATVIIFFVCYIAISKFGTNKKIIRLAFLSSMLILFSGWLFYSIAFSGTVKIQIDGEANSVIVSQQGEEIVIGPGKSVYQSGRIIKDYIEDKVDMLVIPSKDKEWTSGIGTFMQNTDVKSVVTCDLSNYSFKNEIIKKANITTTDNISSVFNKGGLEVHTFKSSNNTVITLVNAKGTTILIAPKDSNLSNVNFNQKIDLCIFCGGLPENYDIIESNITVPMADKKTSATMSLSLKTIGHKDMELNGDKLILITKGNGFLKKCYR